MGCGTGRHLEEFVKRGLKCDGFDLSTEMLSQASKRLAGTAVGLSEGNITDFKNGRQYDLVVAMFAVMGYLTDNESLLAGLHTAQKHLRPEGVFIFDGWFGPAVLAQQPEKRRHEYHEDQKIVVREVTPHLDPVNQTVTVHYDVSINRNGQIIKQIEEDHVMRYMFIQEMALMMQSAGLKLVHYCPFLEPDGQLSTNTWNVTFVARRES
jgi:SAM-dependent methyltransferase